MSHIKKFEAYAVVNKSDLDLQGNWSSDYHVHAKAGRRPYMKNGFLLTEIPFRDRKTKFGPIKSLPTKGVVFLRPEEAEKINALGKAIEEKMVVYNELFDSLIYTAHSKGYDESGLKGSGVKVKEDK